MRRLILLLLVLSTTAAASSARADLIITIDSASVPVDGLGVVNVWIESDDPIADEINSYELKFALTSRDNSTFKELYFSDPQTFNFLTDVNYVFVNQSLNVIFNPWTPEPIPTTITMGDSVSSVANVSVTTQKLLLVQLNLSAELFPLNAGDEFDLSLVSAHFTRYDFADPDFDPLDPQTVDVNFVQPSDGLVTITASVVPEPSTAVLLTLGLPAVRLVRRAKFRSRS